MRSLESMRLPRVRLAAVLSAIPFFQRVQASDPRQLQVLFDHARLLEVQPGEVVIRHGEFDSWFFFVLKGLLKVGLEGDGRATLAVLTPGEIFGALSVIRDSERSATIAAAGDGPVLLLAIDAAPFGELEDTELISAATKLAFLDTVNHALRERLLAYRRCFPDKPLSKHLLPEPVESAELGELANEVERLGELLVGWNESLSPEEHRQAAAQVEHRPDLAASWEALLG